MTWRGPVVAPLAARVAWLIKDGRQRSNAAALAASRSRSTGDGRASTTTGASAHGYCYGTGELQDHFRACYRIVALPACGAETEIRVASIFRVEPCPGGVPQRVPTVPAAPPTTTRSTPRHVAPPGRSVITRSGPCCC